MAECVQFGDGRVNGVEVPVPRRTLLKMKSYYDIFVNHGGVWQDKPQIAAESAEGALQEAKRRYPFADGFRISPPKLRRRVEDLNGPIVLKYNRPFSASGGD